MKDRGGRKLSSPIYSHIVFDPTRKFLGEKNLFTLHPHKKPFLATNASFPWTDCAEACSVARFWTVPIFQMLR